jgi:hypothetical protein
MGYKGDPQKHGRKGKAAVKKDALCARRRGCASVVRFFDQAETSVRHAEQGKNNDQGYGNRRHVLILRLPP